MIDFGGNRIGHPWHGLWRQSTGKITTPAGGDINVPGDPPRGYPVAYLSQFANINTPFGYCFKLQVPGLPAVTTTPAEAAAGETWTNYATLTGASRRIYGKTLSLDGWIYIAPNGQRWRVQLTYKQASYEGKVLEVSLYFQTFGEVSGNLQVVSNVSASIALNVGTTLTGGWFDIDDIKIDGSSVLIAGYVFRVTGNVKKRLCHSVVELAISGNYPGFSVALNQISSEVTDAHATITNVASYKYLHYKWNYSTLTYDLFATFSNADDGLFPANPSDRYLIYPITETMNIDSSDVVGARYSSAGLVQIMKVTRAYTESVSGTLSASGMSTTNSGITPRGAASSTRSASGHVSLMANDVELYRLELAGSSSISGYINAGGEYEYPLNNDSSFNSSWSIGTETVTTSGTSEGGVAPQFPFVTNVQNIHGWRYSNTIFGLLGIWNGLPLTDWGWFFPAIGRGGQDDATVKLDSASNAPYFASEHPENGAVTRSITPVCYV